MLATGYLAKRSMENKPENAAQDRKRMVARLMVGLTLCFASIACVERQFLGFPDGFLTELARAERIIYGRFMFICVNTLMLVVEDKREF